MLTFSGNSVHKHHAMVQELRTHLHEISKACLLKSISRDCHFILWQIASLCSVTTFSSSYICKLWLVLSRSKHLLLNFSERMCSDFFQNGVAKILLHASEFKVEKILFRSKSFSELSLLYGCMHKTLLHQEFLYYKRSFHQFLPAKKSFKSNKSYNVFMSYIRLKLPLC